MRSLQELSQLELECYAGKTDARDVAASAEHRLVMEKPATMRVTAKPDVVPEAIYEICKRLEGSYTSLLALRNAVFVTYMEQCLSLEDPTPRSPVGITVLPDGVYAGDPEDIYYQREQEENFLGRIRYPIKGLGEKIAEVQLTG